MLAVVPVLLWAGYCHAVVATTIAGDADPPSLGSMRELGSDGARTAVLTVASLSIPTVVLLVTVQGVGSLSPSEVSGGGGALFVLGGTVTVCLALAIVYLFPGALAVLATDGSLAEALDPRGRLHVYRHSAYFLTWTVAFVVGGIGATLFGVVLANRGALGLFALVVSVYTSLVAARLTGAGYRRVVG
nr:DUF4013 domain-containing protein [Haloarchaeobius amylolyticus]